LSFDQVGQRVIAKPEDMWTLSSRSVILSACDAVQICVSGPSTCPGRGQQSESRSAFSGDLSSAELQGDDGPRGSWRTSPQKELEDEREELKHTGNSYRSQELENRSYTTALRFIRTVSIVSSRRSAPPPLPDARTQAGVIPPCLTSHALWCRRGSPGSPAPPAPSWPSPSGR